MKVRTRPYATDVGVEAEILWFDRTDRPKRAAKKALVGGPWSARVSVGIATGASNVFIRPETDPWLEEVEACFVRRLVRGRDLVRSQAVEAEPDAGNRLIVPYVIEEGELSPADERHYPGLARFLDAHRGELGQGHHRGPGYYIQCPSAAVIGSRVVVPEVFREPVARVLSDGVAVLNSSFVIRPGLGQRVPELAAALNTDAARAAIMKRSRRLGSGYRRVTARGLGDVLRQLSQVTKLGT